MKEINKPIQVCAWFKQPQNDKNMNPDVLLVEPIKFIIIDEEGESQEVKIDAIIKRDSIQIHKEIIFKYICSIVLYDRKKQCDIEYNTNTMQWVLKRL